MLTIAGGVFLGILAFLVFVGILLVMWEWFIGG